MLTRAALIECLATPSTPNCRSIAEMLNCFMNFRVTIEPDEDGIYVAECPALPGCASQGRTRDEALKNIRTAIKGCLRSLGKHTDPGSGHTEEKIIEIVAV